MKYLKKVILIITMMPVIGCFSPTENKKESVVDRTIFDRVGNVYFNDLLDKSAEAKKPLLLYFTSYACVYCRKMEDLISNDKKLFNSFQNDFIVVPLHVDDREVLPKEEWFYSKFSKKEKKTLGSKYLLKWQMEKLQVYYQPGFVVVNEKGKKIKELGYTKDLSKLHDFFLKPE